MTAPIDRASAAVLGMLEAKDRTGLVAQGTAYIAAMNDALLAERLFIKELHHIALRIEDEDGLAILNAIDRWLRGQS